MCLRMPLPVGSLVTRLGCKVGGMNVVGLLLGDALLDQQFLETGIFPLCILHLRVQFCDGGIRHTDIAACGGHPRYCGTTPGLSLGKCRLSLGKSQTELGVFDDNQCVTLMDRLELLEADFPDETLYTGVNRRDMLPHMGIVGPLHIAKMSKVEDDNGAPHDEQCQDDDVVSPT